MIFDIRLCDFKGRMNHTIWCRKSSPFDNHAFRRWRGCYDVNNVIRSCDIRQCHTIVVPILKWWGCYSPFPRRWDWKWSSECKTKSSMVITDLFANGSFEKRPELWTSRISICIPMAISSLILSGTGCTTSITPWGLLTFVDVVRSLSRSRNDEDVTTSIRP